MSHSIDTLIIGAGHAGLSMSRCLQRAGRPHLILERDSIGSSWRKRWDSFHLKTPAHNSQLPDEPPAPEGQFWSRDAWLAHLEEYVATHELPLRTGVSVNAITRDGDGFSVETSDGGYRARQVVLCTGDLNVPRLPSFASSLPGDVTQLHAGDYRNAGELPPGAVLVVGSAQSGAQICEDLLEAGREVYLCTSAVGRAPRRYRGRDATDWMQALGMHNHGPDDVSAEERAAAQALLSGTRGGHSMSLHALAHDGARLLGRLEGIDGRKLQIGADLRDNVAVGDRVMEKLRTMLDGFIDKSGLDAPPAEPDPADRPFEGLDTMAEVRELDLDEANITSLIWATGFGGSFPYLPEAWRDERGLPRHEDGVCSVPGLYCLGLSWLRRRASGLVLGTSGDAQRIADHIVRERAA